MYVRKEISEHTIFAFLYVFCKMYFIIIFFESIVSIIMRKSFRIMETFDKQVIEFLNIKQIMINICVIICVIFLYGSG